MHPSNGRMAQHQQMTKPKPTKTRWRIPVNAIHRSTERKRKPRKNNVRSGGETTRPSINASYIITKRRKLEAWAADRRVRASRSRQKKKEELAAVGICFNELRREQYQRKKQRLTELRQSTNLNDEDTAEMASLEAEEATLRVRNRRHYQTRKEKLEASRRSAVSEAPADDTTGEWEDVEDREDGEEYEAVGEEGDQDDEEVEQEKRQGDEEEDEGQAGTVRRPQFCKGDFLDWVFTGEDTKGIKGLFARRS
ncbi:hypothetical protein MBLNU457_g0742t1 [Dothideomycetes sp. NU457]